MQAAVVRVDSTRHRLLLLRIWPIWSCDRRSVRQRWLAVLTRGGFESIAHPQVSATSGDTVPWHQATPPTWPGSNASDGDTGSAVGECERCFAMYVAATELVGS
jgi:hypothetical protein